MFQQSHWVYWKHKLENPVNNTYYDVQALIGDNVAGKNKSKRCSNTQTESKASQRKKQCVFHDVQPKHKVSPGPKEQAVCIDSVIKFFSCHHWMWFRIHMYLLWSVVV